MFQVSNWVDISLDNALKNIKINNFENTNLTPSFENTNFTLFLRFFWSDINSKNFGNN
jgi:hypothetical protein